MPNNLDNYFDYITNNSFDDQMKRLSEMVRSNQTKAAAVRRNAEQNVDPSIFLTPYTNRDYQSLEQRRKEREAIAAENVARFNAFQPVVKADGQAQGDEWRNPLQLLNPVSYWNFVKNAGQIIEGTKNFDEANESAFARGGRWGADLYNTELQQGVKNRILDDMREGRSQEEWLQAVREFDEADFEQRYKQFVDAARRGEITLKNREDLDKSWWTYQESDSLYDAMKRWEAGERNDDFLQNPADGFNDRQKVGRYGFADRMAGWARDAQSRMTENPHQPGTAAYYAFALGDSGSRMVPMVATAYLTRNPALAASVMATPVATEAYNTAREEGLGTGAASIYGIGYGIAEYLPGKMVISSLLKQKGKSFLRHVGKGVSKEGLQETVTEAFQYGLDVGFLDENMDVRTAWNRVVDAAALGGLMGGVMGGVQAGVEKNRTGNRELDQMLGAFTDMAQQSGYTRGVPQDSAQPSSEGQTTPQPVQQTEPPQGETAQNAAQGTPQNHTQTAPIGTTVNAAQLEQIAERDGMRIAGRIDGLQKALANPELDAGSRAQLQGELAAMLGHYPDIITQQGNSTAPTSPAQTTPAQNGQTTTDIKSVTEQIARIRHQLTYPGLSEAEKSSLQAELDAQEAQHAKLSISAHESSFNEEELGTIRTDNPQLAQHIEALQSELVRPNLPKSTKQFIEQTLQQIRVQHIPQQDVQTDTNEGQTLYSFAGEQAQNAPTDALARAKQMQTAGQDSDTVWQETGWTQGADGKWRFEIDDSQADITLQNWRKKTFHFGDYAARFNQNNGQSPRIADLISHKELFAAYPHLKHVPVYPSRNGSQLITHDDGYSELYLDANISDTAELKQTLLHEIQHAIQDKENFARGGSPEEFVDGAENADEAFEQYQRLAGEVEARNTEARIDYDAAQRRSVPPQHTADTVQAEQDVRFNAGRQSQALPEHPPRGWVHATDGQAAVDLWHENHPTQTDKAVFWTDIDSAAAKELPELGGYSHSINASAMHHIRNGHAEVESEVSRGQIPVTAEDMSRIPEIVSDPDAMRTDLEGDHGTKRIAYTKKFDDGIVLYVEQASKKKRDLHGVTMWKYPSTNDVQQILEKSVAPALYGRTGRGHAQNHTSGNRDSQGTLNQDPAESGVFYEPLTDEETAGHRAFLERAIGKLLAERITLATHYPDGRPITSEGAHTTADGKTYINPRNIREYRNEDGELILNAQERMAWVAWHELTHRAGTAYANQHGMAGFGQRKLHGFLAKARKNPAVRQLSEAIAAERMAKRGQKLSQDIATEEALAELAAALRTDKMDALVARYKNFHNPPTVSGIRQLVGDLAEIIHRVLSKITGRDMTMRLSDKQAFSLLQELSDLADAEIIQGRGQDSATLHSKWYEIPENPLIAQHNITESGLKHAQRMGGLIAPSVAIAKQQHPLDGFGEITLLADKNLIDPRGVNKTKVFAADIYSPRYPLYRYTFDSHAQNTLDTQFAEALAAVGEKTIPLNSIENPRHHEFSSAMAWQFLKDRNIAPDVKPVEPDHALERELIEHGLDGYLDAENPNALADDTAFVKAANDGHISSLERVLSEEGGSEFTRRITRRLLETVRKEGLLDTELNVLAKKISRWQESKQRAGEVDADATFHALRAQIQRNSLEGEFNDYVRDEVLQLNPREVIADGLTPTGRQRWKNHDAQNVLKMMLKNLRGGESFNYGTGSLRAKIAPQYRSLKTLQADRSRIVSDEAFTRRKEELEADIERRADQLGLWQNDYLDIIDHYLDNQHEALSRIEGVDRQEAKRIIDQTIDDLREMSTEYFEAKIPKVVPISDFRAAVIPDDTLASTRETLVDAGVQIYEYESGNTEERRAKIQQVTQTLHAETGDVLFSTAPESVPSREAMQKQGTETANRIGGYKAWAHAKKDGKTELPYIQWVQARTPVFKQWFGDWEKPLRQVNTVQLNLLGWDGNISKLKKMATDFYRSELQGKSVVNEDMGVDIVFSAEGRGEAFATSRNARTAWKSEMVRVLPELIQKAVQVQSEAPDNRKRHTTKQIHTLLAPLVVNGKPYSAKITVREALMPPEPRHKFYNITAIEIEKNGDALGVGISDNTSSLQSSPSSELTIAELARPIQGLDVYATVRPEINPATGEPSNELMDKLNNGQQVMDSLQDDLFSVAPNTPDNMTRLPREWSQRIVDALNDPDFIDRWADRQGELDRIFKQSTGKNRTLAEKMRNGFKNYNARVNHQIERDIMPMIEALTKDMAALRTRNQNLPFLQGLDKKASARLLFAKLDQIGKYHFHGDERNREIAIKTAGKDLAGSGKTAQEIEALRAHFNSPEMGNGILIEQYRALYQNRIKPIIDYSNQRLRESGLLTPEMEAARPNYQWYIPLYGKPQLEDGVVDTNITDASAPTGGWTGKRKGEVLKNKTYSAQGRRGTEAHNLFETVLSQAEIAVRRAEMQVAKRRLLDYLQSEEGKAAFDAEVSVGQINVRDEAFEDINGETSWQLERIREPAANEIVYQDGNTVYTITVNNERALTAIKDFNKAVIPNDGWRKTPFAAAYHLQNNTTRLIASTFTRFNPDFIFRNKFMDSLQQYQYMLADAPVGEMTDKKGLAGYGEAVRNVAGRLGLVTQAAKYNAQFTANPKSEEYRQWLERYGELGGITTFNNFLSKETLRNLQEEVIKESTGLSAKKTGQFIGKLFDGLNEYLELTTRVSAFRALVEAGVNEETAAIYVKDIMNYETKGDLGRHANALYPFFTTTLYDARRMAKALSKKEGQVVAAALFGLSHIFWELIAQATGDDDDGVAWVDKMPIGIAARNFIIPTVSDDGVMRGEGVRIPIGYGLGRLMNSLALTTRRAAIGRDDFGEFASNFVNTSLIGSFSPLQPSDIDFTKDAAGWAVSTFSPQTIKPILQWWNNSNWQGSMIYTPDLYKADGELDHQSGFPWTGDTFKKTAEILYEATGGRADITPETLQFLTSNYLGGIANTGTNLLELTLDQTGAGTLSTASKYKSFPVLGGFIQTAPPEDRNRYRHYHEQVDDAFAHYQNALSNGGDGKRWQQEAALRQYFKQQEKRLRRINKIIKREREYLTGDALRAAERRAQDMQHQIHIEAARFYEEATGKRYSPKIEGSRLAVLRKIT